MISGINLVLTAGDYLGIVGPNGAGKSTLLKTLINILEPTHGQVRRRPHLRLGYVPQASSIDPIFPLSALEMVRLGRLGARDERPLSGALLRAATKNKALDALSMVGIRNLATTPFRDLSGGQQQRVLIAGALIRRPELLILDEPTQGMDLPSERKLLDTISDLNGEQKMAIILVAHQISLIAGRAKRIALINKDRNLFVAGDAGDILSNERLSSLYAHPMKMTKHATGDITVVACQQERETP